MLSGYLQNFNDVCNSSTIRCCRLDHTRQPDPSPGASPAALPSFTCPIRFPSHLPPRPLSPRAIACRLALFRPAPSNAASPSFTCRLALFHPAPSQRAQDARLHRDVRVDHRALPHREPCDAHHHHAEGARRTNVFLFLDAGNGGGQSLAGG